MKKKTKKNRKTTARGRERERQRNRTVVLYQSTMMNSYRQGMMRATATTNKAAYDLLLNKSASHALEQHYCPSNMPVSASCAMRSFFFNFAFVRRIASLLSRRRAHSAFSPSSSVCLRSWNRTPTELCSVLPCPRFPRQFPAHRRRRFPRRTRFTTRLVHRRLGTINVRSVRLTTCRPALRSTVKTNVSK